MNFKILKYVIFGVLFICVTDLSYGQSYPVYQKLSTIAILDQESLFSNTKWGKNIFKNVENKVTKLAAENRTIESELEVEELNLTKVRKITSKMEFDILAIEFDKKVKKIRDEQSFKQREINNYLNENRKLFFEMITPILLNYIDELGIEVLLNKDTVALASLGSDITKSAINRINEKLDN
ncbi:OmpH family outer membrane protein [Amylibacter sp.]|jgi:Skp family chaperone for outer membrane proteins|nr:OmpH family outer membrane protein [Amylibacter sp.]MDC1532188.1 OmpH family outer membrane protein [Amylibacter sp.]